MDAIGPLLEALKMGGKADTERRAAVRAMALELVCKAAQALCAQGDTDLGADLLLWAAKLHKVTGGVKEGA